MSKEEIVMNEFAARLKILIQENGETYQSIGDFLGLHRSTISRYVNKEIPPKRTTIRELSRYFNVNPTWLMGYDVPKTLNNGSILLSKDEKEIIELYRELSDEDKLKARYKFEGIVEMLNEQSATDVKKGLPS